MRNYFILILLFVKINSFGQNLVNDTLVPYKILSSKRGDAKEIIFNETNILYSISTSNEKDLKILRKAIKKDDFVVISHDTLDYEIYKVDQVNFSAAEKFYKQFDTLFIDNYSYNPELSFKKNFNKAKKELENEDRNLTEIIPIDILFEIFDKFLEMSCSNDENICSKINPCIPFEYKKDGCYARAHWMAKIITENYGFDCKKIFVDGKLKAINKGSCGKQCILWSYHVAPIVKTIGSDNKIISVVLDPSLFNSPVSIESWIRIQEAKCPSYLNVGKHLDFKVTSSSQFYPRGGFDPNFSKTKKVMYKFCRKCR